MIHFLLYSIGSLGLAYSIYIFVLRQEKTFQFNRFFLLISLILCLLAPVLDFESDVMIPNISELTALTTDKPDTAQEPLAIDIISEAAEESYNWYPIIFGVYGLITCIFLSRFIRNLYRIRKLIKSEIVYKHGFKISISEAHDSPCSFFNYLFVNADDLQSKRFKNIILPHELTHSKEKHSIDILIAEFIICFFWFNPFVWLYNKAIVDNHEFIADTHVVKSGIELQSYCQNIIQTGTKNQPFHLSSSFNFIQTKKRLIMLQKSKSTVLKRFGKMLFASGIFLIIFAFSSFTFNSEPLIVVIDAGHGGHDPGNFGEKEVTLKISNMLAKYSNEKIKIITTRSSDDFISLTDRIAIIKNQNPDLVISLHSNGYQKDSSTNGVEAFYYEENDFSEKSYAYGEILMKSQLDKFANRGVKTAGFMIIKNIDCPGVVLELGFLTNEKDKAIITNELHQQEIASALYESLKKIRALKN